MEIEGPQEGAKLRRVVVRPSRNEGSPQPEQAYDDVFFGPNGEVLVHSMQPPEEVFLFGLNLNSHSQFVRGHRVNYVSPSERSITQAREDGLCIYCQLVLLPDAPPYAAHQPSFQSLLNSKDVCKLCLVITSGFSLGCPELQEMYNSGYPPLYDIENRATTIRVESTKFDKHSRIIATCGNPSSSKFRGKAIIWTTTQRLGKFFVVRYVLLHCQ